MKQTLIPIVCALAFAGVARGADADGSVLFGGRAWRLSPECRLEGSILTVTVPKDKARGLHAAVTTVDLAPGAENYLRDAICLFEEYGWDWSYHAFREWAGWSVEHEADDPDAEHPDKYHRVTDSARKRALLDGFKFAYP